LGHKATEKKVPHLRLLNQATGLAKIPIHHAPSVHDVSVCFNIQ